MLADFRLCFLCQQVKSNDKTRSNSNSYDVIITQLNKFVKLDPAYFDLSTIGDGSGVLQTLKNHDAFYHKGCYDKLNESHYQRLVKKTRKRKETIRKFGRYYDNPA